MPLTLYNDEPFDIAKGEAIYPVSPRRRSDRTRKVTTQKNFTLTPTAAEKGRSVRRVPNEVAQTGRRRDVASPQSSADLGLGEPRDQDAAPGKAARAAIAKVTTYLVHDL